MNTVNSNMFGSFNSPYGGKKPDISDKKDNPWSPQVPYSSPIQPPNPLNSFNGFNKQPDMNFGFNPYSPGDYNNTFGYNLGYTSSYTSGYSYGYSSGFDNGFNSGYQKAMNDFNKNINLNSPYSSPNFLKPQDYSNAYSSGYDCGIRNYINAINLINSYSPSKISTPESRTKTNPATPYTQNNNKKYNTWKNNKKSKETPKKVSQPDLDISPTTGEKKPILIIKKISRDNAPSEPSSFSSMLNSLFGGEEDKEKVNYLEDSDDENDNLVTIEDIKCTDDIIKTQKEKFDNYKIVLLKEIINKDNIVSIDDLITIGNYYEKNFLEEEKTKSENSKETKDKINIDEIKDDEYNVMESIIKSLGIPLTPTTNIIINNKTKKTIISSPTKSLSEDKEKGEHKENAEKKQEINTLELYKIGNSYFTINLEKVFKMKGHLIKLKKMIGLDKIKSEIIDMILYYLMEFEKKNNNMLHMTLEGSPGCGKTKLAKIISKLLGAMGILDNDKVVYARRTDMIGQYLGQTGQKTQQVINSALGGVLFIDEAYSLGNSKKDIYSKECLDILNQNLSDNKKKLVCIIAGYPEELENYFFSSNPGLTRRFPFRFKINNYTHSELLDIFINKINKLEWKINKNVNLTEFFEKNISHFKYFGGDIDTLIQDIKYSHSRRVVCAHPSDFKIINKDDINKAFEKFKNRRKSQESENWKGMFV